MVGSWERRNLHQNGDSMAQFKILQMLEDAFFEIMAWLLLLPKTLAQVVFKPVHAIEYVNSEWEKKPAERFDEFLSPVVFWIFVAVLPMTYVFLTETEIIESGVFAVFSENKIWLGAGIAAQPLLIYLMWIELINNRPLRKSALQRMFYIQCYVTAPALLAITLALRFASTIPAAQFWSAFVIAFLIFYETLVMRSELKMRWTKAILTAAAPLVIVGALIALIVLIGQLLHPVM